MGNLQSEIKQTRPFRSIAQEAMIAILRTADVLRRRVTQTIEPYGITLQQYNVLRILRGSSPDPLPTLEIGDRLIEQTPGITRLLDRLEEKGFVRRERCADDRRMVLCRITESGLDLLARLDPLVDAADDAAMAGLPEDDVARLVSLLASVRASSAE